MAPRKTTEAPTGKKAYEHYVRAVPVLSNFEEIYHLEHH